ncbi:hypothetical protein [Bradyrhizobium elkanii]|uniref:Uncharacterized protein n=1 Tax=Bradyrhizobium elkanii TaxID=29448 RepID=A0ABV4F060_BRAEL|nr:hypothetical protein [Bradyrhizobium elkanii]MCP1757827.1 hypothetical protein [Bradyrhizobium elkanii]MCS3881876.1 hypothetical protein [Bradyrhizobium elkanii]MCS4218635.1 hypothetical protein [Bradyrhizobium elkanii]MCW2110065.1 hypothetical protein [Bradyrhizobium elkanii]MCW2201563.1 hypothetical protein [Bradyrhizobium elkanii]
MRYLLYLAVTVFFIAPVQAAADQLQSAARALLSEHLRHCQQDIPVAHEDAETMAKECQEPGVKYLRQYPPPYPLALEAEEISRRILDCSTSNAPCSPEYVRNAKDALFHAKWCRKYNNPIYCRRAARLIDETFGIPYGDDLHVHAIEPEPPPHRRSWIEQAGVDINRAFIDAKDNAEQIAKSIAPKSLKCAKEMARPEWYWAVSFVNGAKGGLAQIGIRDKDTCLAKRSDLAEEAEHLFPGIGRKAINDAGGCLCDQVY